MKTFGAIAESAEDAPLLHTNTVDADEKKPFKGATSRKKTIALAVAGVAACGVVAIAAKGSSSFGQIHNANPSSRLGDALDDAKAGTKDFCSNDLSGEKDSIRFEHASKSRLISSRFSIAL